VLSAGVESVVALMAAGAALATAIGNAIAHVLTARQNRRVNGAVSADLITLAGRVPSMHAERLTTPDVIAGVRGPAPPDPGGGDGSIGPVGA
jgi:hypothetical protein